MALLPVFGWHPLARVIASVSVAATVLVWLAPAVWPPIDAALAVTRLSLTLYGLRRGRRRP
ncbi:hypothetical protein AB0395_46730 [Streptosporangium sp. NPDC051023]|uniref:hypothetical protein n=1 Tax=Streptosporangium sp. NPDC051023 TaxID=3155410 RepID=UPI00344ED4DA